MLISWLVFLELSFDCTIQNYEKTLKLLHELYSYEIILSEKFA